MTPEQPFNQDEILKQVAKGDEKAFGLLFAHYWDHLFGFACSVTKSNELAEEVVQDTFVTAWQHREMLPELNKLDAWLFIVARNKAYKSIRKKVNDPVFVKHLEMYFALSADLPEKTLLYKETQHLVNLACSLLPKQQQIIFHMSRQQGLSLDEIADTLSLSKFTVKGHLSKALLSVRHYLRTHAHNITLIFHII